MSKRTFSGLISLALSLFLLLPSVAGAELFVPDAGISLMLPEGWERADSAFSSANVEVTRIFDCTAEDPRQLKALGWKTESDGQVSAAFCISYQQSGMGKIRSLLKNSVDKEREAVAARFLDSFAGKLKAEYKKRSMRVLDLSADLLESGEALVVVMDGKLGDGKITRLNSSTIHLRGDALLRISFVYSATAPAAVVNQLDAIALSLDWN